MRPKLSPLPGFATTPRYAARIAPESAPRCSGIGAQVLRNECPGVTGIRAQVSPERVPRCVRNTHPTIADAVLDRLVHNAHKLTMKGPSRRKEKAPTH